MSRLLQPSMEASTPDRAIGHELPAPCKRLTEQYQVRDVRPGAPMLDFDLRRFPPCSTWMLSLLTVSVPSTFNHRIHDANRSDLLLHNGLRHVVVTQLRVDVGNRRWHSILKVQED